MLLNRWFGIQLNPHFLGIDLKYVTYYELYHVPFQEQCYYFNHHFSCDDDHVYLFSILLLYSLIDGPFRVISYRCY